MQEFKRSFRLWDFRVSHDQLLLRSPKNASAPRNLDVAFVGVEYLELPTKLRELTLGAAEPDDHKKAEQVLGRLIPKDWVFVISSDERRHLIVAAAVKVFENDLDIFESSLERL
jgi:hypothetical protein